MRVSVGFPYRRRMVTQTVLEQERVSHDEHATWETPPRPQRRRAPVRVPVVAAVAASIAGVLALGVGAPAEPSDRLKSGTETGGARAPVAAQVAPAHSVVKRAPDDCHAVCEFSSSGSADLHAFHHDEAGTTHVAYLEARWTRRTLRTLRSAAVAWRQTVTVALPDAWSTTRVDVDHWASDLPAARVELTPDSGVLALTVTSDQLDKIRAGEIYRTQVLIQAPRNLDGVAWQYHEELEARKPRHRDVGFEVAAASSPRRGVGGWGPRHYVAWDVPAREHTRVVTSASSHSETVRKRESR